MNTSLALTLGHNSSAVLIQDGEIICGYEQERFSTKKSDSSYPAEAISRINELFPLPSDTNICMGHWFLDHKLPLSNKYWNPGHLLTLCPKANLLSIDREFSHHDSHLESAIVFAGSDFAPTYTAIVADGFGSSGECISVYEVFGKSYRLLQRWFGFEKSLGMLYQYATAFLSMKMHNHEYKMLAYETHIYRLGINTDKLDTVVDSIVTGWVENLFPPKFHSATDPVASIDALPRVQEAIDKMLTSILMDTDSQDVDLFTKRCIVSYSVQRIVEKVMSIILQTYKTDDLLLVGGLFYNVKLNSLLAKQVTGRTCIMPLAGDQGAGLGVYNRYFGDLKWPNHLLWGKRNLKFSADDDYMKVLPTMADAMPSIRQELRSVGLVNLVRGAMEFGPRALCNTTTLAIPRHNIGALVNEMNSRTNEMPFALVMSQEQANELFVDVDKIHKSLEYMICTRDFKPGAQINVYGGAHYYANTQTFTCRPQITNDPYILTLVKEFGPLINTSFNFHGVPIVFDEPTIKHTHYMQRRTMPSLKFKTIIIEV